TPLKRLSQLTTQAGFIRALPHFSCIREVLSPGPSEEEPGNTLI
ncbi:transcriptional regulator, partial [Citrobacter freundii]